MRPFKKAGAYALAFCVLGKGAQQKGVVLLYLFCNFLYDIISDIYNHLYIQRCIMKFPEGMEALVKVLRIFWLF